MGAVPVRRCLACRRTDRKDALLRLVVADGTVVADPSARAPGRGAYVCQRADCLHRALRREGDAILRALRRRREDVTVHAPALVTAWEQAGDLGIEKESGTSATGVSA